MEDQQGKEEDQQLQQDPIHEQNLKTKPGILQPSRPETVFLRGFLTGFLFNSLPSILSVLLKIRKNSLKGSLGNLYTVIKAGILGDRNGFALFLGITFALLQLFKLARNHRFPTNSTLNPQTSSPSVQPFNGSPLTQSTTISTSTSSSLIKFAENSLITTTCLFMLHRYSPKTSTVEMTLFTFVRGLDVLAHVLNKKILNSIGHQPKLDEPTHNKVLRWTLENGQTVVFTVSCAEIMYSWFYSPERLPKAYVHWITKMAAMDPKVLIALQELHTYRIEYGVDTGWTPLLEDFCIRNNLPVTMADPSLGKYACEVVHHGIRGCEVHGAARWARGFYQAFQIYLPVHIIPALIFKRNSMKTAGWLAFLGALRSSAFLATFITIVWYSVCFWRSRIGPLTNLPIQTFDYVGPVCGSLLCGLSVLIEKKHRRGEMALYVAPRALYSFWQRLNKSLIRPSPFAKELGELLLFGFSSAVILTAFDDDRDSVRSTVRGILEWIFRE
eukprot:TRINITY_DN18450_c0_g1_i1.p1 TRINITY_DN18450_c0_g1~~TRINITY_DN18450_c0_g1_i1.p1  ORF type:complete len:499 (-),score=59.90 TRINITY_DN18450_c0_g1_i1:82-1578(-)